MASSASGNRKLTFGVRFPPAESPETTVLAARAAEDAGFDSIWAVDSPLLAGELFDPYVDLAIVAQHTERVIVGPAVSPLFLRSPVATASAILSLDRISHGRAVLGLGTGGSALVTLGVSTDERLTYTKGALERQQVLVDQVALFRKLFAGDSINIGKRDILLSRPHPIKIYIAASGPKMLERAGAIADGVIIHVGIWPPAVEDAIHRIRQGAEKVGRDPSAIDIVCSTYTAMSPDGDRKEDIQRIRPEVSFFYSTMPKLLEQAGFDISRRFPDRMPFPDMTHAYNWDEAMTAAASYIPDKVVEQFCLVGPPIEAIQRIRDLAKLGVTQLYVRGASSYGLPLDLIELFGEHIIPKI